MFHFLQLNFDQNVVCCVWIYKKFDFDQNFSRSFHFYMSPPTLLQLRQYLIFVFYNHCLEIFFQMLLRFTLRVAGCMLERGRLQFSVAGSWLTQLQRWVKLINSYFTANLIINMMFLSIYFLNNLSWTKN